jgi:hypothetical protein
MLSIFLFATEIPYLQYILNSSQFVALFAVIGFLITYSVLRKPMARQGWKDRFMMFGFFSIFNVFLVISIASKYNRWNINQSGAKEVINDIKYEFNSMFGVIEADKNKAQATHIRMKFQHNEVQYDRAFKIKSVFIGQDNDEQLYVIIDKGKLGFEFIRY